MVLLVAKAVPLGRHLCGMLNEGQTPAKITASMVQIMHLTPAMSIAAINGAIVAYCPDESFQIS